MVFVLCWWSLGSALGAAIVFSVGLLAQCFTLALVRLSGQTMNALLIALPPLLQVLAVAEGVHLANYFYLQIGGEPATARAAAARARQIGWLPCVLSGGTTAVGLASLLLSRLEPVRSFGAFGCVGVLITTGLVLALVPSALARWCPWREPFFRERSEPVISPIRAGRGEAAGDTGPVRPSIVSGRRTLFRLDWAALCAALARCPRVTVAALLSVAAVCAVGLPQLRTSVSLETLFRRDSRIVRDYKWIESHVGPLVPIEVLVRFDPACQLSRLQRLALISSIESRIAELPAVGGVISPVTFFPGPRSQLLGQAARSVLPGRMARLLAQHKRQVELLGFSHEGEEGEVLRLSAYVSAFEPDGYGPVIESIREATQDALSGLTQQQRKRVQVVYTGVAPVIERVQEQLLSDLGGSFAAALAVIAVVMTLILAGIRLGLVAMIPNVFPVVVALGALALAGWPLDIGSIMTASVALGIAVDDTLHFLSFFQRRLADGDSVPAAVLASYRHCGRAMLQTSVICACGMLVFAAGEFVPVNRFAWLTAAMIALALVGDLVLLPALLLGPCRRLFERQLNRSEPPRRSTPGRRQAAGTGEPHRQPAAAAG